MRKYIVLEIVLLIICAFLRNMGGIFSSSLADVVFAVLYEVEDYEISILNYSYADKQLTVNAFAKNNTNDALVADAIFAVYSGDGRLKGIKTQPLSVDGYSDTGIDVWFENYTYASGDYVKMFMYVLF